MEDVMVKVDPIQSLPSDVVYNGVLTFLEPHEIGRCCRVSKAWNSVIVHDAFWRRLLPGIDIPQEAHAKRYIDAHALTSLTTVLKRIRAFAPTVSLNQVGSFTCLFPFNPRATLSLQFGYGKINTSRENPKVTYLFMKKILGSHLEAYPTWLDDMFIHKDFSIFTQSPVEAVLVNKRSILIPENVPGSNSLFVQHVTRVVANRVQELQREGLIQHNGRFLVCAEKAAKNILRFFF